MKILLLLCTCTIVAAQNYVTVRTSYGVVQGRRVDYGNDKNELYYGQADVFLGIPYAQPPTGNLRFRAPRSANPYNQIYDATYYRPKCPQANAGNYVNEDCLYLNVFTQRAGNQSASGAVMVFIDGANGFGQGGCDSTTQKGIVRNLVSRGVVVVTLQYRLGALGFFTTFTQEFQPNLGMLDQVLALQWVNSEISNFGGDPNRVTLCGQGDGGCAVSAHTLSPISQTLFQQAIIQSGPLQGCYSPDLSSNGPVQTTSTPVLQYDPGVPYAPIPAQGNQGSYNQGGSGYQQNMNQGSNYNYGVSNAGPNYGNVPSGTGGYTTYDDANPSQQLAQELCNITPEQWRRGELGDLSNCLHNYTVDIFVKTEGAKTATWMIVRDDTFLPDTIQNLAARRPPIPIIIGTVQDEDADYAFKLVADGQANLSQGELFNTWMVDFAKKNKLSPNAASQISNILTQSYNITANGQQYDTNGYPGQYNPQIGGANQPQYQPGTFGHANEGNGYSNPSGCTECEKKAQAATSTIGYGNINYGYSTQSQGYSNQESGYNYQSNGYGTVGGTYNQSSSGYNNQNSYNVQYDGYVIPTQGGNVQNMGYSTPSTVYGGQTSGYSNSNSGYSTQTSGYTSQNSGYNTQTSGYTSQSSGYNSQSSGYSNQNYGYGNQPSGYDQGNNQYQNVGPVNQGGSQGGMQYDQNRGSNYVPSVTNPQAISSLRLISQLQSDAGIMSQTATQIDSFMQNGNQYVRLYQFTHVTDLGRQNTPYLGSWKPVLKGQDMVFLFMSETVWGSGTPTPDDWRMADQMGERWTQFAKEGQVSNWPASNPQNYNYCDLNRQPTVQTGYAQQARTVFNNQVYPIVQQNSQNQPRLYDATTPRSQPAMYSTTNFIQRPVQVQYSSNGPQSSTFQISFQLKNVPGGK
ncbi:Carboxylesterase [Ancylostoma caninum]|uniref:Carboxylesterase n=1 Tax=Ancylostoma caninum TaxID=29170 RepID=A0A368H8C7_ANCCA|nr:Carboxylesterase [Ancylostoma caninum]